jgi:hypothetical protein
VSQHEVDFVIGTALALEVKATQNVSSADLKGLLALREEGLVKSYLVVSMDEKSRKTGGISLLHIHDFLRKLWDDELF